MSGIPDNKQGQGENKKVSSDNKRNSENYREALKTESTKYRGKRDSKSDRSRSDKTVNLHKTTGDYYKQDVDIHKKEDKLRSDSVNLNSQDVAHADRKADRADKDTEVGGGFTFFGGSRIDKLAGQGDD